MFYSILVVYYIICLLYVVVKVLKQRKNTLIRILLLVFCPFIGLLITILMDMESKAKQKNLPEWLIRRLKEREENVLVSSDFDEEINIISIEDALILNNNKTRRKMLLDLLKGESLQNIDILESALQNDDTETSHYAASAILEAKRKLLNVMQKLEIEIEENPADYELLSSYAEVLKQYIKVEFLDENTRFKYMHYYSQILEKMLEIHPQEDHLYIKKINCHIELNELEEAKVFCKQFLTYFPNHEEAHLLLMKLYYILRNESELKSTLNNLRNAPVLLTPKSLKKIRFWIQGE